MGPVHRLDRRVPASAEAQRLALRSTRDIVRRAFGQVSFPRARCSRLHVFRCARQVGLLGAPAAVDLPPPPTFHRPDVKPPDPDEDIDGAHIALGSERRVHSLDDTIGERVPIVPAHRFMALVEVATARLSCRRRPELSFYARTWSELHEAGYSALQPKLFLRLAPCFRLSSPKGWAAFGGGVRDHPK